MNKETENRQPLYEYLLSAFDVVEKFSLEHPEALCPVKVEKALIPFICKRLGISILRRAKSYPQKQLFGALLRYHDRAEILYSVDLNLCWRRYVVVKELGHLLLDASNHYTTNPIDLVEGLINQLPFSDMTSAVDVDRAMTIFAVELLLPHSCSADIMQMHHNGAPAHVIATKYRVPSKLVDMYLSTSYQAIHNEVLLLRPPYSSGR